MFLGIAETVVSFIFIFFILGKVFCYLFIYLLCSIFLQKSVAKSLDPPTIKTRYNPPRRLYGGALFDTGQWLIGLPCLNKVDLT